MPLAVGPNLAFLLAIAGTLTIYGEFIRPGRIFPGALGCVFVIIGGYSMWRLSPTVMGSGLIALAVSLFAIEAVWHTKQAAGVAGTAALALGSCLLYTGSRRIAPALGISLSIVLGCVTTLLAYAGKSARQNKRSDL